MNWTRSGLLFFFCPSQLVVFHDYLNISCLLFRPSTRAKERAVMYIEPSYLSHSVQLSPTHIIPNHLKAKDA